MQLSKVSFYLTGSLTAILSLTGCNTLMAPYTDSEFQEFEQLFNQTMLGREFTDLQYIWNFPEEFILPTKVDGEKIYWPLHSKCAYFAVEKGGKIVGLSKEYNGTVEAKKYNSRGMPFVYDQKVYNVSRCVIPKNKLQKLSQTGNLKDASESDFEIFGIKLDKTTINEFRNKYPRCKLIKIKSNLYEVSNNCLPFKAKEAYIYTNKDNAIDRIQMKLDMGADAFEASKDYEAVLSETYGTSLRWYSNGPNWWIKNSEISFFTEVDSGFYASQRNPVINYVFKVQSSRSIGRDLEKKYQEKVQKQVEREEAALEKLEDKQYRQDSIRKSLK